MEICVEFRLTSSAKVSIEEKTNQIRGEEEKGGRTEQKFDQKR
jgi:hypothetical protein